MRRSFHSQFVHVKDKRLSADEKRLTDSAEWPLWQPVSPIMINDIHTEAKQNTPTVLSAIFLSVATFAVVFGFGIYGSTGRGRRYHSTRHRKRTLSIKMYFVTAVTLGIFTLLLNLYRVFRYPDIRGIDNSAVGYVMKTAYAHQVFKDGSRIAFYLPDGKYILDSPDAPFPAEILLIKYNGHTLWRPLS